MHGQATAAAAHKQQPQQPTASKFDKLTSLLRPLTVVFNGQCLLSIRWKRYLLEFKGIFYYFKGIFYKLVNIFCYQSFKKGKGKLKENGNPLKEDSVFPCCTLPKIEKSVLFLLALVGN
jgi:hypothetical protein